MNNMSKLLPLGLVLGGGIGIVVGAAINNIPMGIVFGGGFGLVIGLVLSTMLDRHAKA